MILPDAHGGVLGSGVGAAAGALLGFTGGSLILLLLMAVGFSLFTGVSWLSMAERTGEWVEQGYWKAIQSLAGLPRPQAGRSGAAEARSQGVGGQAEDGRCTADPHRAGGERSAAVAARRHREAGAAVFRSARFAAAAAASARPGGRSGGNGQPRVARIHVADDRAQARRIRRRGQSRVGLARPGHHALRNRTGGRRQGQPDRQSVERPGAHAVGHQHPRGRSHSRQAHHGAGDSQSQTADRAAVGDSRFHGLSRQRQPADRHARQGHRRQPGGGRSRQDAAPAGGGHHRLGQVGRRQRHDPVAGLQVRSQSPCA